eukprot:Pompholyxophrys_punicea_v1_NODE_871_length_1185_cov_1.946018.p3 type:complete len:121 gc:universal NODE_871_length_1185_cov_1.946018:798-1160(+)
MMDVNPRYAARCSGVTPSSSAIRGSACNANTALTSPRSPLRTAICRSVLPIWSALAISSGLVFRAINAAVWPCITAKNAGVCPSRFTARDDAPYWSSNGMMASWSIDAARCKAVLPYTSL